MILTCIPKKTSKQHPKTNKKRISTAGWRRTARTKLKMAGIIFWTLLMHILLLSEGEGSKSYNPLSLRIFLTHNFSCRGVPKDWPSVWSSPWSNISVGSAASVSFALAMDWPKDWPVDALWPSASRAKEDKARTTSSFWTGLHLHLAHTHDHDLQPPFYLLFGKQICVHPHPTSATSSSVGTCGTCRPPGTTATGKQFLSHSCQCPAHHSPSKV